MLNGVWTAAGRASGLKRALLAGAGVAAMSLATAEGTWSIVIVDTRTGEVAVASATCLTGFDLEANTPVLVTGVGAATAQSFVDTNGANRTFIRDGLVAGAALPNILAGLAVRDSGHQGRQYGMADVRGGTLTFSGTNDGVWAGGRTGRIGDVVYAVQGNVLTGAPVVDRAVEAIEQTPGDVAAKLMAGMEAARSMGGDGRCSCNVSRPDSCGSPPPDFTKAAHIAYMLIARAGDVWNCRAAYRTQNGASDILLLDGDGDGKPDFYAGATGAPSGLLTMRNISGPFGRFADPAFSPAGGAVRALAAGDLDGDGRTDLVGMITSTDRLVSLRGVGPGFSVLASAGVGRSPVAVALGDFNGDGKLDAATMNSGAGDYSVLLGVGDGTFRPATTTTLGATPIGLIAADLDGDGKVDLATLHGSTRSISLLRGDGLGGFTRTVIRTGLPFTPAALMARDANGDGRPELFVCGGSNVLEVLDLANPASDRLLTATSTANCMELADLDGDGTPDLLCAGSSGTLSVYRGLGGGEFGAPETAPMGFAETKFAVRDIDGDGDLDVVYVNSGTAVVMSNLAGPGRMPVFENAGCASGSGYMEFNVANQQAGDPDPVLQLHGLYDAWRDGLVGVADAVVSRAVWTSRETVPADGRARRVLRVELLDWRGQAAEGAWTLEVRDPAGVAAAVESVTQTGPGVYEATVRAGRACGEARFEVVARGAGRTVTLMPSPVLVHTSAADANDDGFVDFFDYDGFVELLEAGDPAADADGDGAVTPADYDAFLRSFTQGC